MQLTVLQRRRAAPVIPKIGYGAPCKKLLHSCLRHNPSGTHPPTPRRILLHQVDAVAILKGGKQALRWRAQLLLEPGDIVYVPERII